MFLKKKAINSCLLFFTIACYNSNGQITPGDNEQIIAFENFENASAEASNLESYLMQLEHYEKHPLNLNKADYADLESFGLLSDRQILALLEHRKRNGSLLSVYELQTIPYFDIKTIKAILSYCSVTITYDPPQGGIIKNLKNTDYSLIIRSSRNVERAMGYILNDTSSNGYLGSPYEGYLKFSASLENKIKIGLTAQKDPGEKLISNIYSRKIDFLSAYIHYKGNGSIPEMIIGNYELRFGEGLLFWQGFSLGKSTIIQSVKKSGSKIKPYTSANEAGFMSGLVGEIKLHRWNAIGFISKRKLDAKVIERDPASGQPSIVGQWYVDGLHRTNNERSRGNNLISNLYGIRITKKPTALKIGMTTYYNSFSASISETTPKPYNTYYMKGNWLAGLGIDYSYSYHNFFFFGEVARSFPGGAALLNGALISLGKISDLSIVYRKIARDFHAPYNKPFSEYYKGINEDGFFIGLNIIPAAKWRVSAYTDVYHHPWLKFSNDAPSSGVDRIVELVYSPTKLFKTYLRFKYETKERNVKSLTSGPHPAGDETIASVRWHITYPINPSLTAKNRLDHSIFKNSDNSSAHGVSFYQEINYKPKLKPLWISFRLAVFDISSYDARIYAFENQVLYKFGFFQYFDRGVRGYLLFRLRINANVNIWLRLARTNYIGKQSLGSGLNEIAVPHKTSIDIQLRFKN